MKVWKIVAGILSIILFVIVSFQSCAVGIGNVLLETGEVSGSGGMLVAIMILVGGIISLISSNGGKGLNIALIVIYIIGALLGFATAGSYKDLYIWSAWCLINVIMAIFAQIKSK